MSEDLDQGEEYVPDEGELVEETAELPEGEVQEEVEPAQEGRTIEEKVEVLKEVYGLETKDFVTTKSGEVKIIQKINGKSYLVTPKQMAKGFGLQQAGYQRLNEAKTTVKQHQEFLEETRSNPNKIWELADELGVDKYTLAEQLLREKLAEHDMSPEEREAMEWEKKFKEQEEENNRLKTDNETRVFEAAKKESMTKYDEELTAAMRTNGFTAAAKETKSHVLVGAIQKLMLANSTNREMSADEAVYLAKQDWEEHVLGFFDDISDDHITRIVPERIINAIRKADLNNLEKDRIPTVNSSVDGPLDLEEYAPPKKRKQGQSITEFFEQMG